MKLQNNIVNSYAVFKKNGNDTVTLPVKSKNSEGDKVCFSSKEAIKKEETGFKSALKGFAVAFGSAFNGDNQTCDNSIAEKGLAKLEGMAKSGEIKFNCFINNDIKTAINKDNEGYLNQLADLCKEKKIEAGQIPKLLKILNKDNQKYLAPLVNLVKEGKLKFRDVTSKLPLMNEVNVNYLGELAGMSKEERISSFSVDETLKVLNKTNEKYFSRVASMAKNGCLYFSMSETLSALNTNNEKHLEEVVNIEKKRKSNQYFASNILTSINKTNEKHIDKLTDLSNLYEKEPGYVADIFKNTDKNNEKYLEKLLKRAKEGEFDLRLFPRLYKIINNDNEKYFDKLIVKLPLNDKKGVENFSILLPLMPTLNTLEDKKNINELTLQEKRVLTKFVVKLNANLFDSGLNKTFPILPNNKKEYCSLLPKLLKSIGIDTKPLTADELNAFNSSMEKLPVVLKNTNLDEIGTIKLKNTRENFVKDAKKLMENLDKSEQSKVMDYFGFEIKGTTLTGYPANLNNGKKLVEIEDDKTKAVIERLRPVVKNYSENNEVLIPNSPELAKVLNNITKAMPELLTIIGKTQHKNHDYNLDVHTLKVLRGVINNPDYVKLNDNDKKILTLATLLHDIRKPEGVADITHPKESAFDAFYISNKLNLDETDKQKLYTLIATHDWPKQIAASQDKTKTAQDFAFELRGGNSFEMSKILCKADLGGVKKNVDFYNEHLDSFNKMSEIIDENLTQIQNTAIPLPQTRIPKASELKNVPDSTYDGITNKVIKMYKPGDVEALSVKIDDFYALVHAIGDDGNLDNLGISGKASIFDSFSSLDSDALLSTSFIDAGNYKVFRQQGFILDVDTDNIHAGYFKDFGSGFGKDLEELKEYYLFDGSDKKYRNYISDQLKQRLNCSDEEYKTHLRKISHCKSMNEVRAKDENFANAFKETFAEMDRGKRAYGRQYNEILVSRPKIQGVFAYDKQCGDIPKDLRQFAADNDLPIILFGK